MLFILLILLITVPAMSSETQWKSLPDGTRIPIPPKEHPRLYLRASQLEDLKARIDHPWKTDGFREIEKVNDGGQRFPNGWVSARELDDFLSKDYKTGDVFGRWFGPDPKRPDVS